MEKAFECVDLNWGEYVVVDEIFYRPTEVHRLMGDYRKSKEKRSWKPEIGFDELIKIMIDADLKNLKQ